MITLRLDPELEQTINTLASEMGMSKSEIIRQSITEFIAKKETSSAWELGNDVFGKYVSPDPDLATNRKLLLKEKINNKHEKNAH